MGFAGAAAGFELGSGVPTFGSATSLSTSITTDRVAIPTTINGTPARYLWVRGTSGPSYIQFGDSSVTATVATGILVLNAASMMTFNVAGQTHMAGITASGSGEVYIAALENQ